MFIERTQKNQSMTKVYLHKEISTNEPKSFAFQSLHISTICNALLVSEGYHVQ